MSASRHPLDELTPADAYAVLMMEPEEFIAALERLRERDGLTDEQRARITAQIGWSRQAGAELDRALWRPGFLGRASVLAEAFRASAQVVRRVHRLGDEIDVEEAGVPELGREGEPDPVGAARAARAALALLQPGLGDLEAAGVAVYVLGLEDGPWVDGLVALAERGDRLAEGLIRRLDPDPVERSVAAAYLAEARRVEPLPPTEA